MLELVNNSEQKLTLRFVASFLQNLILLAVAFTQIVLILAPKTAHNRLSFH